MTRYPTHTTIRGTDIVAVVLAIGIGLALNILTFAVLWDALHGEVPGISENATQILTGWGGGIIGVIGAVVGYRAGANAERAMHLPPAPTSQAPPSG